MSKTDDFNLARQKLASFRGWSSKIGKRYQSGAGGEGSVTSAKFTCTIYHQPYDGANNYHDPDKDFLSVMAAAAKEFAPQILKRAEMLLEDQLRVAALAASKEAQDVLAAIKKEEVEP